MGTLVENAPLHSDDWRVLHYLATHPELHRNDGPLEVGLSAEDTARCIFRLSRRCPPLINRIGDTPRVALSTEGRKWMQVSEPPPPYPPQLRHEETSTLGPGPRGQLVRLLKKLPRSTADLVRLTGLEYHQVHYFLKTLQSRGLLGATERSPEDGRVVLYRLKPALMEPAKPLLTPAVIALTDPCDWHTWLERLLLEKMTGMPLVIEEDSAPGAPLAAPEEKIVLPKVLIVGRYDTRFQTLIEKRFGQKLKVYYFDARKNNPKDLVPLCRRMDHAVIRSDACDHKSATAVKSTWVSVSYTSGNYARVALALDRFLTFK